MKRPPRMRRIHWRHSEVIWLIFLCMLLAALVGGVRVFLDVQFSQEERKKFTKKMNQFPAKKTQPEKKRQGERDIFLSFFFVFWDDDAVGNDGTFGSGDGKQRRQ